MDSYEWDVEIGCSQTSSGSTWIWAASYVCFVLRSPVIAIVYLVFKRHSWYHWFKYDINMTSGLLGAAFSSWATGHCTSISVTRDFIHCCVSDFILVGSSLTLAAFVSWSTLVLFAFVVGRGADHFFSLKLVLLLLLLSLPLSNTPFPKSSSSKSCGGFFSAFFSATCFIDVLSQVRIVLRPCSAFQCQCLAHSPTSGWVTSRKAMALFHSFVWWMQKYLLFGWSTLSLHRWILMAVLADALIISQLAWDIMLPSSLWSAFSIGGWDKSVWVAGKTLWSAWVSASIQRISWG